MTPRDSQEANLKFKMKATHLHNSKFHSNLEALPQFLLSHCSELCILLAAHPLSSSVIVSMSRLLLVFNHGLKYGNFQATQGQGNKH